jgi:catalase
MWQILFQLLVESIFESSQELANNVQHHAQIKLIQGLLESAHFSQIENVYRRQQQIENILLTLNIIDNNSAVKLEPIKKQHIDKCITWCQLYQLPYNRVITTNNIFLKNSPLVTT